MTLLDYCTATGINPNTARDRLKKEGLNWNNNRQLTPEIEAILSRVKSRAVVPAQPREKRELNGHAENHANAEIQPREKKEAKPREEPKSPAQVPAQKDGFFLSALWVTMGVQMGHTAAFFWLNCPIENEYARIAWAVGFAYGVDCTALVMTMKGAGKWILVLFLFIHITMNVTYHLQAHDSSTGAKIWGFALLSSIIAFANYSYTALYSKK